jgi:hypothetical protein
MRGANLCAASMQGATPDLDREDRQEKQTEGKRVGGHSYPEVFPACNLLEFRSLTYVACVIRVA